MWGCEQVCRALLFPASLTAETCPGAAGARAAEGAGGYVVTQITASSYCVHSCSSHGWRTWRTLLPAPACSSFSRAVSLSCPEGCLLPFFCLSPREAPLLHRAQTRWWGDGQTQQAAETDGEGGGRPPQGCPSLLRSRERMCGLSAPCWAARCFLLGPVPKSAAAETRPDAPPALGLPPPLSRPRGGPRPFETLEASPAEAGPAGSWGGGRHLGAGLPANSSGSGFSLQLPRAGSGARAPAPGFAVGSRRRVVAEEAPAPAVGRARIRCRVLAAAGWGSCRSWPASAGPAARPSCGPAGAWWKQHGRPPLPDTGTSPPAALPAGSGAWHPWRWGAFGTGAGAEPLLGAGDGAAPTPPGGVSALPGGPLGGAALCARRRHRPSALPRRANGPRRCQVAAEARRGQGCVCGREVEREGVAGRAAPSRDPETPRAWSETPPGCRCLRPGLRGQLGLPERRAGTAAAVPRPGSDPPGGQRRGRARQPAEVWAVAAVIAVGLLSSRKTQGAWFKQQKAHPIGIEGRWWTRRQGEYSRRVGNAIAPG